MPATILAASPAGIEFGHRLRRFREARRLSVDEMGRMLVISGSYVYTMERGIHEPCPRVREAFETLAGAADVYSAAPLASSLPLRSLPIISWAHAGQATLFEELPAAWQECRDCRCPDGQAFLLRLVGDSMEKQYHEGDLVVVMPNHQPKSPCLVVAKLADGGYCFKQFSERKSRPHCFRLSSYNRTYPSLDLTWGDVEWVFPVYTVLEG